MNLEFLENAREVERRIYDLIINGSCSVQNLPKAFTPENFYHLYFCFLTMKTAMQYVPTHYDALNHRMSILSAFREQADPVQWKKYQDNFQKKFHQPYNIISEQPKISRDLRDNTFHKLKFAAPCKIYAVNAFVSLNDERLPNTNWGLMTDDYGWIEDRWPEFIRTIAKTCDDYCLPRLPIAKKDNGASTELATDEWQIFFTLYTKRWQDRQTYTATDPKILKKLNDSNTSHDERRRLLFATLKDDPTPIHKMCQDIWRLDNEAQHFPSALSTYPEEKKPCGEYNHHGLFLPPSLQ